MKMQRRFRRKGKRGFAETIKSVFTMFQKRQKLKSYQRTIQSYAELYIIIIHWTRQELYWLAIILSLLTTSWFLASPLVDFLLGSSVDLLSKVSALIVFVIVIATYIFLGLVVYFIVAGIQNPARKVGELSARLLVAFPRPHSNERGLNYQNINHLKRVAEIEKTSSGWRTSFINWAIIGVTTFVVSTWAFWKQIIVPSTTSSSLNDPSPWSHLITPYTPTDMIIRLSLLVIFLIWILLKWVSYLRDFLTSEAANRILLIACEEVLLALERFQLSQFEIIPIGRKRELAEYFGCKLLSEDQLTVFDYLWGPPYQDTSGNKWFLIPPEQYSTLSTFTNLLRRLLRK